MRLGTALVLMGTIALVVFVLTYSAGMADLRTLLAGAGLTILGLFFRRRGTPAPEEEPARFRTVRKLMRRPPAQEPPADEESS
ncbi:MAG TPA: hypothetical protein VFI11_10055 [Anaerolineales bacterium]|nr:hypothetical protein [Anaerolineales bacterium]